jgi:transposase
MRGDDQQQQSGVFSYVALEDRIPADHPLRGVRKLVDAVLAGMSTDFEGLYSKVGRPSIPPERLLRALLLQVFYSVRSERLLMEQLSYNLLFRWWAWRSMTQYGITLSSARTVIGCRTRTWRRGFSPM